MKKIWFDEAWEDYIYWQTQDKKTLKRINMLLKDEEWFGFSVRNLQQMKKFYTLFTNTNALRSQLTWTNYRLLCVIRTIMTETGI